MNIQKRKRITADSQLHWRNNVDGDTKIRAKDIVFTKGGRFDQHPGNLRYCTIVQSFLDEYQSKQQQNQRSEKIRIVREIIATVKRYGGRFVTFNAKLNQWVEMPSKLIQKKVSRTLRDVFDSCPLEELPQL